MTAWKLTYPKFQGLDSNGSPLASGKLHTYAEGTTTNKTTWSDSARSVANANPIVLDSRGEADVYGKGAYKFVLKNAADVTIWTLDNISVETFTGRNAKYLSEYTRVTTEGSEQSALDVARADIGVDPTELVIDEDVTMEENITFPTTCSLSFTVGSVITATGYLLTINGPFRAGIQKAFTAVSGEVVFGAQSVEATRPEWFANNATPGATDMTDALRAAYGATVTGGRMRLLPVTYRFTSALIWDDKVQVLGTSKQSTILMKEGTFTGITVSSNEAKLADFFLDGEHNGGGGAVGIGMLISDGDNSRFERIRIARQEESSGGAKDGHGMSITGIQTAYLNQVFLDTNEGDGLRIDDTGGGAITSTDFNVISCNANSGWGVNLLGGDTLTGRGIILEDNISGGLNIDDATRNFFSIYEENNGGGGAVTLVMSANSGKNHIEFVELDNDSSITDNSSDGNVVSGLFHGSNPNKYPEWETPTYSSGNFTYSGTGGWGTTAGDITTYGHIQHGKIMTVAFDVRTSTITNGDGNTLRIALPDSKTSSKTVTNTCAVYDNGAWTTGTVHIDASATVLSIKRLDAANFTAGANVISVRGTITLEVQ